MTEVLIDLPNLYNVLARTPVGGLAIPREYLLQWLDLDLLAASLGLPDPLNVWVFYADKTFGHHMHRVEAMERAAYVKRLDRLPGVTTKMVGVPGEENETFRFQCTNCGSPNEMTTTSEKGVDSALIAHLFDTIEHWREAVIVSGDADFCPAISSARRRGRLVYGAGVPSAASPALIRECHEYFDVLERFVKEDFLTYRVLHNGGIVPRCLEIAARSGDSVFEIRIPSVDVDDVTREEAVFLTIGGAAVEGSPTLDALCAIISEIVTRENGFIPNEETKSKMGDNPWQISRSWFRGFTGKASRSLGRLAARVNYPVDVITAFRPYSSIRSGVLILDAPRR